MHAFLSQDASLRTLNIQCSVQSEMANKGRGYGFTAELEKKKAAKYDPEREKKAREWMTAVVGSFPEGSFQEALKDGVFLCQLINVLQPESVKKFNSSQAAFKMMENIGSFLKACETYGLTKMDLFQTVDLYEAKNMPQVIDTIFALGRRAQKNGYDGPTLGPKEADKQERRFSEEQLRGGESVIGLQMGTNKLASQSGMTPYGLPRQVEKVNLQI